MARPTKLDARHKQVPIRVNDEERAMLSAGVELEREETGDYRMGLAAWIMKTCRKRHDELAAKHGKRKAPTG